MNTEKKKFIRKKPNLSVCTMGHVDHGKTTLTSAITYILSKEGSSDFYDYESIDRTPEEKKRKITISVFITRYFTEKYHVIHSDAPGHEDFVKNATVGFSQADNGILVVAANDGAKLQTREHLNLAKRVGIKKILVCVTKLDLIPEEDRETQFELVEDEIKEIALKYKYEETDLEFLPAYSLLALKDDQIGIDSIKEVIKKIDEHFICPAPQKDKPFLMSIESKYQIKGRGTVVAGRITYGKVMRNEKLNLVGLGTNMEVKVLDLEMFKQSLEEAYAGDNPGILLSTTGKFEENKCPIRGQSLIRPKSYKTYKKFTAQIYVIPAKEGGRKTGFHTGYKPQFFIRTADITGVIENMYTIDNKEKVDFVKPGDFVIIDVVLNKEVVLTGQDNIIIREAKITIASGKVIVSSK